MPPLNIYSNGTQPQITTAPRIAATTTTATTTTTTTQSSPDSRFRAQLPASLILRLRAPSATAGSRRIRWAEDVIDNEGLGRKKSKGSTRFDLLLAFSSQQKTKTKTKNDLLYYAEKCTL